MKNNQFDLTPGCLARLSKRARGNPSLLEFVATMDMTFMVEEATAFGVVKARDVLGRMIAFPPFILERA